MWIAFKPAYLSPPTMDAARCSPLHSCRSGESAIRPTARPRGNFRLSLALRGAIRLSLLWRGPSQPPGRPFARIRHAIKRPENVFQSMLRYAVPMVANSNYGALQSWTAHVLKSDLNFAALMRV